MSKKPTLTTVMVAMHSREHETYYLQTQGICKNGLCIVKRSRFMKNDSSDDHSVIHHGSGQKIALCTSHADAVKLIKRLLSSSVNWHKSAEDLKKEKEVIERLCDEENI